MLMLSMLGKIFSRQNSFLIFFFQKIGFDIRCKLPSCMKCQSLPSGKKKEKEKYHQFAVCRIWQECGTVDKLSLVLDSNITIR